MPELPVFDQYLSSIAALYAAVREHGLRWSELDQLDQSVATLSGDAGRRLRALGVGLPGGSPQPSGEIPHDISINRLKAEVARVEGLAKYIALAGQCIELHDGLKSLASRSVRYEPLQEWQAVTHEALAATTRVIVGGIEPLEPIKERLDQQAGAHQAILRRFANEEAGIRASLAASEREEETIEEEAERLQKRRGAKKAEAARSTVSGAFKGLLSCGFFGCAYGAVQAGATAGQGLGWGALIGGILGAVIGNAGTWSAMAKMSGEAEELNARLLACEERQAAAEKDLAEHLEKNPLSDSAM